jgi:hypothetical protein
MQITFGVCSGVAGSMKCTKARGNMCKPELNECADEDQCTSTAGVFVCAEKPMEAAADE